MITRNNTLTSRSLVTGILQHQGESSDATRYTYELRVDGRLSGEKTGDVTLTVDTDPSLKRMRFPENGRGLDYPFFGEIKLSADDGDVFVLTANANVRPEDSLDTVLLDTVFTPISGRKVEASSVVYASPVFEAPNCTYTRDSVTRKSACTDGQSFFIP